MRTDAWIGKRVYLVGAGKSGLDAAVWLLAQGAHISMNDIKSWEALGEETREALTTLENGGAEVELGLPPTPVAWAADMVVTSPGVPLSLPGIREALDCGMPVTNEIKLGWQISRPQIVGVTGSNGKTTVTTLIGRFMEAGGLTPFVGGNIGTPFIRHAPDMAESDWALLELSSFQLAGILSLAPKVAVFLNLSPDHLDWHTDFADYAASKWKIASYQDSGCRLILNYDDPLLRTEGQRRLDKGEAYLPGDSAVDGPGILWFSRQEKPGTGLYIDGDGWVVYNALAGSTGGETRIMPVAEWRLPGLHNQENLLAALGAGLALGIDHGKLRACAADFQAIEHRMEPVGEYGDVLYVNDSKATNPDSAIRAMLSYDRPILLIAGGDGKGVPFDKLAEVAAAKVKTAVLLGRDKAIIKEALVAKGLSAIYEVATIEEAADLCRTLAKPGDMVLLSPACSSLDMYSSYEERGALFKMAVRKAENSDRG